MTKTYADLCLERAEKAQGIAVQRHFSLETGCDAYLELQKLDNELRDKIVPELARRLKAACLLFRNFSRDQKSPLGIRSVAEHMADELEAMESFKKKRWGEIDEGRKQQPDG